ncbi:hypothetical protein RSPPQCQH_CDS0054 [Mycolicibacterium phage phi1_186001]
MPLEFWPEWPVFAVFLVLVHAYMFACKQVQSPLLAQP